MEYNSFYGGRRGASFIIAKSFRLIEATEVDLKNYESYILQEIANNADLYPNGKEDWIKENVMTVAFAQGGQYKTVNYDEYVIIDTFNKNDKNNGKVYRRGYNYIGDLGGAEYIGQIVGPAGLGPHAEIIDKNEVNKMYADAAAKGDALDYRYGEGTLDVQTNDLIPGAIGPENARTEFNDKIHWEYFSLRDEHDLETTCYIGYQVPYTVFDFETEMVEPYKDGTYADTTAVIRNEISAEHPFYERWKFQIPKGVKGDTLRNFKLYTPEQDETLLDIANEPHQLKANCTVLIYEYWWFDSKKDGELKRVYLGEYEVIKDILIAADGTVTVKYQSNKNDTVFNKRIQWIDSVTLTETGVFTVNYNNGAEPYVTNLKWVKDVLLDHDGTVTLVYNNETNKVFEERINWVDGVRMADNGLVTFTYNNGEEESLEPLVKWIKDIQLTNDGTINVTYNDDDVDSFNQKVQWITSTQYSENERVLIINYNTGKQERYDYRIIDDVTLTDEGVFKVIGTGGFEYLSTNIIYPKEVELTSEGIFTIKNNDGTVCYTTNLIWVKDISVQNDRFVIHYNNNELRTISDVLINDIEETIIPVTGEYAYQLLVYYTAVEKRGDITYNGREGWISLGQVKDYNGILIGHNIDSSQNVSLDDPENAVNYLNTAYKGGIKEGYSVGKVVTIGPNDDDKRLYAYDYENNTWFYLGNPSGVKDIRSIIVGANNDSAIAEEAQKMPTGSLWFVLEGDE